MKSFYIALAILVLLVFAITLNYLYINNVSNHLLEMVSTIRTSSLENRGKHIDEIYSYWSEEKNKISMSVGYVTLNKMDDTISSLQIAYIDDEGYEFEHYLAILENSARELARLERFSVFNIL